jgi:polar amino acid transport system substrate-binding protein
MKQSRCAQVQYTSPVIVSTESFGVPKGNPKHIKTIADVKKNSDLKIVVLPGAFEQGILKNAGVPSSQMVKINDNRSGIEAVLAGRADAFLLPTLSLKGLNNNNKFTVTPPIKDAPETGSGAGFRKSDQDFVAAYNKALEKLKKTKEFDKILKKWGFDPKPAKTATVKQLCKNPG